MRIGLPQAMLHSKSMLLGACLGPLGIAFIAICSHTLREDPPHRSDRPIHERIDEPSLVVCGGCHLEAYKEWSGSLHGRAWTNANVQNSTRGFQKQGCRKCHSPRSIFDTGLDRAPVYREANREDGVHCLSCHGLKNGVAATRTIASAPCKPIREPRLTQARLCYPCHEPTHGAFEEYLRSDAFALGLTCAACHMQQRELSQGHSHGANGGLNPEFVKRGLAWRVFQQEDYWWLELRNRSGHRFPGEIPSRSLLIRSQVGSASPELLTLARPRKGETRRDNRLEPDEVRKLRLFPVQTKQDLTLDLYFRPLPLLALDQCFLLGQWSQEAHDG